MKNEKHPIRGARRFVKTILKILWIAWAVLSCNLGSYPDLGNKLDTLTSIGKENATAWMQIADDGHSDILVLGSSSSGEAKRFVFVTMASNSTGSIQAGTYESEDDRIILSTESEYNKKSELDHPPSSREGSTRTDYDPPRETVYRAKIEDDRLYFSRDGGDAMVMIDLWDMIPTIDSSTQSGVDMLVRVFNLSTVSLQMRIPGFGGAGLLQYAREPSEFVGVIGGVGSIEMTSVLNPVVEILFDDYQDFPGILLNGDQLSTTDMAGDGNLTGSIHFLMTDPREGGDFSIEGSLTYQLTLANGTSSDGGYAITLSNGTEWFVPYKEAENLDFRPILPPS